MPTANMDCEETPAELPVDYSPPARRGRRPTAAGFFSGSSGSGLRRKQKQSHVNTLTENLTQLASYPTSPDKDDSDVKVLARRRSRIVILRPHDTSDNNKNVDGEGPEQPAARLHVASVPLELEDGGGERSVKRLVRRRDERHVSQPSEDDYRSLSDDGVLKRPTRKRARRLLVVSQTDKVRDGVCRDSNGKVVWYTRRNRMQQSVWDDVSTHSNESEASQASRRKE